ncbi:MAG TPA: hypothetical protein VF456_07815 [Vicinamibacterales bacterium]
MTKIPLFTLEELTSAFALLLPADSAKAYATEWFEQIAGDNVDERGYYLYEDWRDAADVRELLAANEPSIRAVGRQRHSAAGRFISLRTLSMEEWHDWLIRFSDFHLNLLAASSPVLFDRIRAATGDSVETANHKRQRILELITA